MENGGFVIRVEGEFTRGREKWIDTPPGKKHGAHTAKNAGSVGLLHGSRCFSSVFFPWLFPTTHPWLRSYSFVYLRSLVSWRRKNWSDDTHKARHTALKGEKNGS
jgi:hypothetical protein